MPPVHSDEKESEKDSALVVCRPGAAPWLAAGFVVVLGVLWLVLCLSILAVSPGISLLGAVSALFMIAAGIWAAVSGRGIVTADQAGLRWKKGSGESTVSRDQVRDFYYRRAYKSSQPALVLETDAGSLRIPPNWRNRKALEEAVRTQATHARIREWGWRGRRGIEERPATFEIHILRQKGPAMPRLDANLDALTMEVGGERVSIPWTEIRMCTILRGRRGKLLYRIEGAGHTVEFDSRFEDFRLLAELITQYAPQGVGWNNATGEPGELDPLGGQVERWATGVAGYGPRTFRYRNRMVRALLWGVYGFVLAPPLLEHALVWLQLFPAERAPSNLYLALAVLVCAWAHAAYALAYVATDYDSITYRSLWGRTTIPWNEVNEYSISGDGPLLFARLISTRCRIRFWFLLADLDQLKQEIEERAVNGRPSGRWKEFSGFR